MALTVKKIENPAYANAEKTVINCLLTTELYERLPFSATSFDPEPHGVEIFNDLVAGEYGKVAPFKP